MANTRSMCSFWLLGCQTKTFYFSIYQSVTIKTFLCVIFYMYITVYTTFKIINKIFLNACMCAAGIYDGC